MVFKRILSLFALVVVLPCVLRADTVVLKNGTSVEGAVIKFGTEYRVKLADGTTRIIPEKDVATVGKSGATAAGPSGSASFNSTRARAEAVDAPVLAVTIWEKFIEANSSSADLPAAKTELAKWQRLQNDHAERINGKWVGGDDRKKLMAEVNRLCAEARGQLESQTLQAIEKYEKALKLYPNCFEANFALGYYYLRKGVVGTTGRGSPADLDRAIRSLEVAVKLRPNSPSALSNLAIGYNFRQRYEDAVMNAYKAAKIHDNKPIVENLVNCLVHSPPGFKANNSKIQPVMAETAILAQKYGINTNGTGGFHYIPPEAPTADSDEGVRDQAPPGIVGNGSGFLVSADGYIITNRHVVGDKNRIFRVRFDDGTEKPAEVIAIDAKYDVALIKVKADKPLPFLKLAETDLPNPGAQCMVLGYPIASLLDFKMQVANGQISSTDDADEYQVTLSANTTHGNSGGPIVDRDGNVIGILSAATVFENATYLKAISAGQIRGFLQRIKDKQPPAIQSAKPVGTAFNGEQLASDTRKATLMVLIIRGDGKESAAD
ncbi:MAG TPA: trypsin-like peptidase domain-containing protein [Tepidisphaeraceae bacterium]|nr:trypsin-like peptidase domain-containing protein [Tepidisphaeraceae bacterium]